MDKWINWLVVAIGVLLILPLIGVTTLGSVTDGIAAWIIGIAVLIVGVMGLKE